MANEPEHWSANLTRAMYWIHEETMSGHPVTQRRFLAEFKGSSFPKNYGKDLLAELGPRGNGLINVDRHGFLHITVRGRAWFAASIEPSEQWYASEEPRWVEPAQTASTRRWWQFWSN